MPVSFTTVPTDNWDRIFRQRKRPANRKPARLARKVAKATANARRKPATSQGVTVAGRDLVAALRSALAACGQSESTVGKYRTDRIRVVAYRSGATFEGLDGPSLVSADVGDVSGPARSAILISRDDAERLVKFTPDRKSSAVTIDTCNGLRLRRDAASIVATPVAEPFPNTAAILDTSGTDGRYFAVAGGLHSALRQAVTCSNRPNYSIAVGGTADGITVTAESDDGSAEASIVVPGHGYGNEIAPATFNGRRLAELASRFGRHESVTIHLLDSTHRDRPIVVTADGLRIAMAEQVAK